MVKQKMDSTTSRKTRNEDRVYYDGGGDSHDFGRLE